MNTRGNLPKLSVLSVAAISISLLFTTAAFALGPSNRPSARPSLPAQATARLEGAKLQACQARENAIKTRSEKLAKLAATIQEKFDAIASRVAIYYTSKLVPDSKTVSNYDTLVAAVQTKKDIVQTALTQAQNNISGFSCADNNPKAMLMQFNEDMRAVKSALQDYKISVKNLIVAVRSVTGQENEQNPGQSNTRRGGNQ